MRRLVITTLLAVGTACTGGSGSSSIGYTTEVSHSHFGWSEDGADAYLVRSTWQQHDTLDVPSPFSEFEVLHADVRGSGELTPITTVGIPRSASFLWARPEAGYILVDAWIGDDAADDDERRVFVRVDLDGSWDEVLPWTDPISGGQGLIASVTPSPGGDRIVRIVRHHDPSSASPEVDPSSGLTVAPDEQQIEFIDPWTGAAMGEPVILAVGPIADTTDDGRQRSLPLGATFLPDDTLVVTNWVDLAWQVDPAGAAPTTVPACDAVRTSGTDVSPQGEMVWWDEAAGTPAIVDSVRLAFGCP